MDELTTDLASPDDFFCGPCRHFAGYELIEEIGRGGMGVIFKARQRSLNRTVAIKMILSGQMASAAEVKRFQAEAKTAANLRHPNVVAVYEVGEHKGQHYFSMDYVQGRNLAQMARDNPLPSRRAAGYLKTIAEAIHYAHSNGTLHRDLKPSNVLIDEFDQPRITDFGLAKQLQGEASLTETGQVLGSPGYLPPEQVAAKHGQIGAHSDVYSLGALLYYLLTARPPFQAETLHEVLIQVLEREPVSPRLLNPSVPRDLETICLRCLQKEASRRYPRAHELAEELGRYLRDEPILARPAGPVEKLGRWVRRNQQVAFLLGAVAFLLLTITVGSTWTAYRLTAARAAEIAQRDRAEQASNQLSRILTYLDSQRAKEAGGADAIAALRNLAAKPVKQSIGGVTNFSTYAIPSGNP